MMRKLIRFPTTLLLSCLLVQQQCLASDSCNDASLLSAAPPEPLARRKGSQPSAARLVGLFDVHEGDRCHLLRPGGMEHVLMAAAALERGLLAAEGNASDVGFEIYDTCSSSSVSLHHLMHALAPLACPKRTYVGVIGPKNPEIQLHLSGFLKTLGIPYVPLEATSLMDEVQAMCKVLSDLRWKVVSVISSNEPLLDEFRRVADQHNICIASSATMLPPGDRSDDFLRMKFQEATSAGVQVAVVLGSGARLGALQDASLAANSSVRHWLLAGTDEDAEDEPDPFSPDHPVILFRRSPDPLSPYPFDPAGLEQSYEFGEKIRRLDLVRSYAEFVRSCAANESGCADQFRHSDLQRRMVEESVGRLFGSMLEARVLKLQDVNETDGGYISHSVISDGPKSVAVEIWTYQHSRLAKPLAKHKQILVGHFTNGSLNWDKKVLNVFRAMGSGWFKIPEFHCQPDCGRCENADRITPDPPQVSLFGRVFYHRWRHEAWVSVLLTVSCVGAIAALLAAAFLVASSCREDSDEGSQASNLLLLAACLLCYACTLLFAFDRDAVPCRARLALLGLAHASLLAPPLSRVLILVAAEMDGVHSHVSGFLQASLCAALAAPQVAMATYFWLGGQQDGAGGSSPFRCAYEAGPTSGYLSYGALLSLCWLVASPFSARSRRNHREGLLLHFCGVAVALAWLAFALLFFLLGPRWNEFAVCTGVVAAPTAVLATLFAPKVYKVVVATAARRHGGGGHATLQPVVFASTSSRSPNLSIYESVNHGFNPDKDGFVVDVFRDEEDSPRPRKMTHL